MASRFRITSLVAIALTVATLLGGATQCSAAITLTFDNVGITTGTLSYLGAGGPAVGTDITFDRVTGIGTPANNGGSLTIVNGELDFETGGNTLEGPALWSFAGGGSFTLTGDIPALGLAAATLLSGSFTSANAFSPGGFLLTVIGFGVDTKHQELLDYFDIAQDSFVYASTNISADSVIVGGDGSFSGNVTEADITNSAVPEPMSFIVWAGLFGVAAGIYKRRSRVN